MTSTLVLGVLVAFVATTLAAALRRAPTRAQCPACGAATAAVQPPPWLLKRMPDVRLRWCHACSWQGWGRDGAEWVPGHPAAHRTGFHWGEDRVPEDLGFRFADQTPPEVPAEPPHHPSGFRFSPPPAQPPKAHPSGFAWAQEDSDAADSGAPDE
ncbi:MAG TPA: hypothetical protein VJ997_01005, partial [Longimicrobiales bacterium]|nr:hypothetical protein [Longimicrobiales bacterium]